MTYKSEICVTGDTMQDEFMYVNRMTNKHVENFQYCIKNGSVLSRLSILSLDLQNGLKYSAIQGRKRGWGLKNTTRAIFSRSTEYPIERYVG